MEFKGNEFVRNIEIEKEKVELEEQVRKLEAEKVQPTVTQPLYDDEPVIIDIKKDAKSIDNNDIDDFDDLILLDNNNSEAKKKYIMLTIALTVLFVLTIIIIRLISTDNNDEELFENTTIKSEIVANKDIVAQVPTEAIQKTIQKDLNIDKIVKEEVPIAQKTPQVKAEIKAPIVKNTTSDVFNMEKKEKAPAKVKVAVKEKTKIKIIPKKKPLEKVKQKIKEKTFNKPVVKKQVVISGIKYYLQVGAFTKNPAQALLNKIKKYKYSYIIHKMNIKGTMYNKVLVGPYKSRGSLNLVSDKIKKDLNANSAYVVKLK